MIFLNNIDDHPPIEVAGFYLLYYEWNEMWALIETALRHQNVKFLEELLTFRHWNRKVTVNYAALAFQIRGSGINKDPRRLFEKYCIFEHELKWIFTLTYLSCKEKGRNWK